MISSLYSEQVKVLALTDHDTMSGVPEAIEAARRYGIKIIPGVEISTIFSPRFYSVDLWFLLKHIYLCPRDLIVYNFFFPFLGLLSIEVIYGEIHDLLCTSLASQLFFMAFDRGSESEEPVHILAYYSSCGPTRYEELEKFLASIRDGRYLRAKDMILKLNKLKLPLKWEHVVRIAGKGVAPGRLHVARAMVEAGYVDNLKQAFARYLYDGGPAYAT